MKRLVQLIALMLPFFYMATLFAGSCFEEKCTHLSQNDKIYISSDQLEISSQGIFVHINNERINTEALFSDEIGVYIRNPRPHEDGCRDGYEPCRNCDRCVRSYYDICPLCYKPV